MTLCHYAASLWLIIKFAQDIANDLDLLNVGGESNHSRRKMQERFAKMIQFHSNLKQLSSKQTTLVNIFVHHSYASAILFVGWLAISIQFMKL